MATAVLAGCASTSPIGNSLPARRVFADGEHRTEETSLEPR
jgi:hypothetical protein